MAKKTLKKGLDKRARDEGGEIRHKRRDTMVKTLRAEYASISPRASSPMRRSATF
jgi:hypothetical protein